MSVKEDKQINKEIANKIKEARIKKGWMQAEVAKKAGIDSNSYHLREAKHEKIPWLSVGNSCQNRKRRRKTFWSNLSKNKKSLGY